MDADTLVIVNPVAGPSATRVLEKERLGRLLKQRGLPPEWEETEPDRDAGAIVDDHPGEGPVVVLGGDGTVHAAASRLVGTGRPLLPVPRGSGNVFARALGIPSTLDGAMALLEKGRKIQVDVGRIGDDIFLLGAGIGLDADVIRGADRALKSRIGGLAYVVSATQALPVDHHEFEIEIDGRKFHERAAAIHVANFGTLAGPFRLPPMADGRDGVLDLVVMRAEGLEETLNLLATPLISDQSHNKGVRFEQGHEIQVRARKALPVQIDGEDQGDHPGLHCRLMPGALTVIAGRD